MKRFNDDRPHARSERRVAVRLVDLARRSCLGVPREECRFRCRVLAQSKSRGSPGCRAQRSEI